MVRHPEVAGMGMPPVLAKVIEEYEPAGEDEENAYNIVVSEGNRKFFGFFDPLSAFGTDLYYKIPATSLTMSTFP